MPEARRELPIGVALRVNSPKISPFGRSHCVPIQAQPSNVVDVWMALPNSMHGRAVTATSVLQRLGDSQPEAQAVDGTSARSILALWGWPSMADGMLKPEGRGLTFAIVISIWAALSTLTISLRIWARCSIRAFAIDDWLMVFGWIIFMVVLSFDYLSIRYGIGAHANRISSYQASQALKWFLFSGIGYAIATVPIKASICVLLMRLTAGTGKKIYTWILNGVILLACIGTITRVVGYTTRCKPFVASWETVDHGHCSSAAILTNVTWFFSGVCIFTDWVCAILPVFMIWDLKLPLRAKLQVGCILALGMLASVATIIRMKHVIDYQKTHDFLFGLVDVGLWSETETFLGIVAGSLATMRPLLAYIPCISASATTPISHIEGAQGTLSEQFRGRRPMRRDANGEYPMDNLEYMGHSFQIISKTKRDGERGREKSDADSVETGSQKHILRVTDMEIVKETHYEVRTELSDERDDLSHADGRRIGCGL